MADNKEWYTLQDIQEMTGATVYKVRTIVAALRATGDITAREKPFDRRVIEVNKDSIPKIRKALTGEK